MATIYLKSGVALQAVGSAAEIKAAITESIESECETWILLDASGESFVLRDEIAGVVSA